MSKGLAAMETAGRRFDRAWNGCKCRGETSCMVCQACAVGEIRGARNDALGEAARTICARCAGGAPVQKGAGGHFHEAGMPCVASAIHDLREPADGE
jgi:hypothetical protein